MCYGTWSGKSARLITLIDLRHRGVHRFPTGSWWSRFPLAGPPAVARTIAAMSEPTELGHGRGGRPLVAVVPVLIGVAPGWALLDRLLGPRWIPIRGPLSFVGKPYWRQAES